MGDRDRDASGYCSICKFRTLEERYPLEFRAWLDNLTRLHLWQKAGYPLHAEDLDFDQWQALAMINRYYEVKDIEAAIPRVEE